MSLSVISPRSLIHAPLRRAPNLVSALPKAITPLSRQDPNRTFFTIVEQGKEAWRLSFGRNPTKLKPGLHLSVPLYHEVTTVDLRETSIGIKDLTGFTSDNVPVVISGSLFFRVQDSYKASFAVGNFQENVKAIGTSAMRSVIGHFTYDEVIADRNKTNARLHEIMGNSIAEWGISCTRFEIQNFHPSNRDVEKQLELQMQAERERRKQILDTQALVNVAEGQKQRSILESEGALQSQLNLSSGEKQATILRSEGARDATLNQSYALADQVEIIARSLMVDGSTPSEDARRRALETIVELRRIEQLQAIAQGSSNATYFFGGGGSAADQWQVDNDQRFKTSLASRSQATP